MQYQDFDLQLDIRSDQLTVAVIQSPAGEAQSELVLPEIDRFKPTDNPNLQYIGTQLFDALFVGEVRNRYDVSRQIASAEGKGLRVRLRSGTDPQLGFVNTLPWEGLYDERMGEFLALSRSTPLVRYIQTPQPSQPDERTDPLRIIGLIANPEGVPPLNVESEQRWMEAALKPLVEEGQVELQWQEDASWRTLQEAMQRGPWHIIHFVGHGYLDPDTGANGLLLADDDNQPYLLDAASLDTLVSDQEQLRLLLLNACHGANSSLTSDLPSMAADLVRRGTAAVLAMQDAISDGASIEFGRSFYGALADGLPVDAAVVEGRKAVSLASAGSAEWVTPVLYMRADDGVLWEPSVPDSHVNTKFSKPLLYTLVAGVIIAVVSLIAIERTATGILDAVTEKDTPAPTTTNTPIPTATPVPTPVVMKGEFNIAIANFGQMNEHGNAIQSDIGTSLSLSVYEQIKAEFEQNQELVGNTENSLWHDEMENSTQKNVDFGFIEGIDAKAREASARALADKIGADLVVYGNLLTADDPNSLALEFFFDSPILGSEFGASLGANRFGAAIPSIGLIEEDETVAKRSILEPLSRRTKGLFWLTLALTYDVTGNHIESLNALEIAAEYEAGLSDAQRNEVIYYFQGRAALRLRQHDTAITALEEATRLRPDYTNAYISLAGVYFDRAQLFFFPPQSIPEEARECFQSELTDRTLISTEEEAIADLDQAIVHATKATALAESDPWPAIQTSAHLTEGVIRQLLARAYLLQGNTKEADQEYTEASSALQKSIDLAQEFEQPEFLGWSHLTLAGIDFTKGGRANQIRVTAINENNEELAAQKQDEASVKFQSALDHVQICIDQKESTRSNLFFQKYILECGCVAYQGEIAKALDKLGGEND